MLWWVVLVLLKTKTDGTTTLDTVMNMLQKKQSVLKIEEKTPYQHLSTNFMAHRKLVGTTPYNEDIKQYGFEDVLLGKRFKALNAQINHIDNPVLFDDFELNAVFLRKTEEALRTLSIFQTELKGYSNLLEMAENCVKCTSVG